MRIARHKKKRVLAVVASIVVLGGFIVLYAILSPRWWRRAEASVYENGRLAPGNAVYVSREGVVAIPVPPPDGAGVYLWDARERVLYMKYSDRFFFVPGGAFNQKGHKAWVPVRLPGKTDLDPKATVSGNTLTFISIDRMSIRVVVSNPHLLY